MENQSCIINGIIHIKDLLNEDSKFLSLADLKAKFNLDVPFTTYYGLLNAIPANWEKSIQIRMSQEEPHMGTHCLPNFHLQKQLIRP